MGLPLLDRFRKGGARGAELAPANTPAQIEGALTASGMDQGGNFRPGRPLNPYFGYSGQARAMDYPLTVNTATQGRAAWGRPSYDVLKAIIDAYDVARMCINHKIDELRSMPLMFQPADSVDDDVDEAIDVAKLVLAYPDRQLPYESWLSKWLENAFKYDSAPLYRRRNYDGDIIGLEVMDGKTLYPYIDENGRRPVTPAPAYGQIIHGMIGQWFTTEDVIYVPFRPQEDTPFGMAPIESMLLTANTDIRFQWHFLQLFTDGSVPAGFIGAEFVVDHGASQVRAPAYQHVPLYDGSRGRDRQRSSARDCSYSRSRERTISSESVHHSRMQLRIGSGQGADLRTVHQQRHSGATRH